MEELWRDVPSLPEYMASSFGRIMRKTHFVDMPRGGARTYGGIPHHGAWDAQTNRFVHQYKGTTRRVAVLVCEAFHGLKPFPHAVVMHKDEDSRNNFSDNLAWGTQKENLNAVGFLQKRSDLSKELWKNRRHKNRGLAA